MMRKVMYITVSIFFLINTQESVAQVRPNFVDLTSNQTPIRDQGSRNTCITFGALAALEAAYKRAGYGSIDLSEEFLNHMGKTFWLHYPWSEIAARGEDGWETQVGAFGGGSGVGYLRMLSQIMKVPQESLMPYRESGYSAADYPGFAFSWTDPYWSKQKRRSDFNLDKRFLPQAALTADRYYSVRSLREISGRDVAAIERVLASGKELTWEVSGAFPTTALWDTCMTCPNRGAHSMLLVGYDRRDPDPKKHFFIVKNSWGPTTNPGGFTRVTYDYLRTYGREAAYIESINPPQRFYELAFIGRWDLNYDGHKGTLDIYHIPHISDYYLRENGITTTDNRIGTFYDHDGNAFKVNGMITGASIRFYIDGTNKNPRWDVLRGREFSYTLLQDKGQIMAGMHRDPDGRIYGGFARKDNAIQQTYPLSGTVTTASYVGTWNVKFNNINGTLRVNRADPVLATTMRDYEAYSANLNVSGKNHPVRFFVEKKNPNHITMQIPAILGEPGMDGGTIGAYLLNFDKGVASGTALYSDSKQYGFIMFRSEKVLIK